VKPRRFLKGLPETRSSLFGSSHGNLRTKKKIWFKYLINAVNLKFFWENRKETDKYEDLDVDVRTILKWMFEKYGEECGSR
jgi:hypothetical protein